jgi:hypothetical protein
MVTENHYLDARGSYARTVGSVGDPLRSVLKAILFGNGAYIFGTM